MLNFGFIRIASAIPSVSVADCDFNIQSIIEKTGEAYELGAEIVLFPELSVTSYTCDDLFHQSSLINKAMECIIQLRDYSREVEDLLIIAGAPVLNDNRLYDCAFAIQDGEIIAVYPKTNIPENQTRWFSPASSAGKDFIEIDDEEIPFSPYYIINKGNAKIAVTLGNDYNSPVPHSSFMALAGANIILNPSAYCDTAGSYARTNSLIAELSERTKSAYIMSSAGYGESTTDMVFAGHSIICEKGVILNKNNRFSIKPSIIINDIDTECLDNIRMKENFFNFNNIDLNIERTTLGLYEHPEGYGLIRKINKNPFIPEAEKCNDTFNEIFNIQTLGLVKRLEITHSKSIVVGISGGLDSTLALLVAVAAFEKAGLDKKGIYGITMPGFGTSDRTHSNANTLMETLGVTIKEIPIRDAVVQHFKDIEHDVENRDVTYENSQARERTQILMDFANKVNGMVLGTGDLSELALGWATYNGDHMSMYGVNASIPKTLMQHIIKWYAQNSESRLLKDTLTDIVDTPISPELIPVNDNGEIKQKTEDLVGPYELHDFFIYYMIKYGFSPSKIYYLAQNAFADIYDNETIKKWLKTFYRRFFTQQFKRSCLPDGPMATEISLSPRTGWKMPSDASAAIWTKECEQL